MFAHKVCKIPRPSNVATDGGGGDRGGGYGRWGLWGRGGAGHIKCVTCVTSGSAGCAAAPGGVQRRRESAHEVGLPLDERAPPAAVNRHPAVTATATAAAAAARLLTRLVLQLLFVLVVAVRRNELLRLAAKKAEGKRESERKLSTSG